MGRGLGADDWERARLTPELVRRALRAVEDPELGENLVDLGLVLNVVVGRGNAVDVRMTLPRRDHPLVGELDGAIGRALARFRHAGPVTVHLVWQPTWTPAMVTPDARARLGWRY